MNLLVRGIVVPTSNIDTRQITIANSQRNPQTQPKAPRLPQLPIFAEALSRVLNNGLLSGSLAHVLAGNVHREFRPIKFCKILDYIGAKDWKWLGLEPNDGGYRRS